nr:FeoC-like transcriptional regulator [Wenzhouxiangella limi]
MAMRFRTDPDALRGMLSKWISKGRVQKLPSGTACGGGCCRCDPQSIEIYEWRG